jgi:hypothetical protein
MEAEIWSKTSNFQRKYCKNHNIDPVKTKKYVQSCRKSFSLKYFRLCYNFVQEKAQSILPITSRPKWSFRKFHQKRTSLILKNIYKTIHSNYNYLHIYTEKNIQRKLAKIVIIKCIPGSSSWCTFPNGQIRAFARHLSQRQQVRIYLCTYISRYTLSKRYYGFLKVQNVKIPIVGIKCRHPLFLYPNLTWPNQTSPKTILT